MQKKYLVVAAVASVLLLGDQVSKSLIPEGLSPGRPLPVIAGGLEFRYAENTGIAFSLFQDLPAWGRIPLFSLITLMAVLVIMRLLRETPAQSFRLPLALGCIMAGALGNLADRFRWGAVVDFIRVTVVIPGINTTWPIFNLADAYLTVGIFLMLLDAFFGRREGAGGAAAEEKPIKEAEAN